MNRTHEARGSNPLRSTILNSAWLPDPVGRHDLRYWSGAAWTEHVSDLGILSIDPIAPPIAGPVSIRPSWAIYRSKLRAVQPWRWLLRALLLAICLFALYYGMGGWIAVILLGGFGAASVVVLAILYFKLTSITADGRGITIRNQIGVRRFVPRERIGAVALGKAWSGGVRSANYAFVVSPAGEQLGKWFLDLWDPADFRRLANAMELELYGRPDRRLDEFHTGRNTQRLLQLLGVSFAAGLLFAVVIVVVPIVILVVLLVAHRA